jgi:hypothetical protein
MGKAKKNRQTKRARKATTSTSQSVHHLVAQAFTNGSPELGKPDLAIIPEDLRQDLMADAAQRLTLEQRMVLGEILSDPAKLAGIAVIIDRAFESFKRVIREDVREAVRDEMQSRRAALNKRSKAKRPTGETRKGRKTRCAKRLLLKHYTLDALRRIKQGVAQKRIGADYKSEVGSELKWDTVDRALRDILAGDHD